MEMKMIGNKIAEARKRTAISQAQLAEQLFISAQAVGKWERGESIPDIITFNRMATILGVDLNYFSDDFPSVTSENSSAESLAKAPDKPAAAAKNKLTRDMSNGNWVGADFSGLTNLHEKFSSSNMQNCVFAGSDLSGLLLKNNYIDRCDFSGSDLRNSRLQNSHLAATLFNGCVLNAAEISGCHLKSCDFSGADLTGAVITASAFQKNTLTGAVLNSTSFKDTSFTDTIFEGTLEDCNFENCGFTKTTFRNSTLTNTFFKGKGLKKITFIDCQADRMTYEFLKNGKAELSGISVLTTA